MIVTIIFVVVCAVVMYKLASWEVGKERAIKKLVESHPIPTVPPELINNGFKVDRRFIVHREWTGDTLDQYNSTSITDLIPTDPEIVNCLVKFLNELEAYKDGIIQDYAKMDEKAKNLVKKFVMEVNSGCYFEVVKRIKLSGGGTCTELRIVTTETLLNTEE